MNSKTFQLCLVIIGTVIILGLVTSLIIYEEEITTILESKRISFEVSESSTPLYPEKNMTLIERYDIVRPVPGGGSLHNVIYVYHDNERNVTCYLYNGISCIPDCYINNTI